MFREQHVALLSPWQEAQHLVHTLSGSLVCYLGCFGSKGHFHVICVFDANKPVSALFRDNSRKLKPHMGDTEGPDAAVKPTHQPQNSQDDRIPPSFLPSLQKGSGDVPK